MRSKKIKIGTRYICTKFNISTVVLSGTHGYFKIRTPGGTAFVRRCELLSIKK